MYNIACPINIFSQLRDLKLVESNKKELEFIQALEDATSFDHRKDLKEFLDPMIVDYGALKGFLRGR